MPLTSEHGRSGPCPAPLRSCGAVRPAGDRRRGVTLVEAILYLTVTFSVITFSAQTLMSERNRQEQNLVAGDLRQYLGSTQGYVAARYDRILGELYDAAVAGSGDLAGELDIDDVVAAGYLPTVFVNNDGPLEKVYGQDFRILARAVLRGNPNIPQTTATLADVEAPTGGIDPILVDRQFDPAASNDEIDLEVLLVTAGGTPVQVQNGNRIVAMTQMPAAGFMERTDPDDPNAGLQATGPYGAWIMDVTPFDDAGLLQDSGEGYFASLVALSNYGAVTADPADVSEKVEAEETLSRCSEVPAGTEDHEACLSGNELFSSIVFNAWDSDGEGGPDIFPGLSGVGEITMSDDAAAPATITGVRQIVMTGEGHIDQLLSISCLAGGSGGAGTGLTVDCPETRLTGTLVAAGPARFGADIAVDGGLTVGGPATLGTLSGGSASFTGSVTVAGELKAGLLTADQLSLEGLSVGGTRADQAILMSSDIVTFQGSSEPVRIDKPQCGDLHERDIVAVPMSFAAGSDIGSAYDRGTKVDNDWFEDAVKAHEQNKDVDWPMERHQNKWHPGQIVAVETDITSSVNHWKVSLNVTRRPWFYDITTVTETNPAGAQMLVQTLCRSL